MWHLAKRERSNRLDYNSGNNLVTLKNDKQTNIQ